MIDAHSFGPPRPGAPADARATGPQCALTTAKKVHVNVC